MKIFEGYHNFFNFCFCKEKDKISTNTFRLIKKITVSKVGDFVVIKVVGKGFLRYQIRAIIGESLYLFQNGLNIEVLKKMLSLEINKKYSHIAPSCGLYL